MPAAAAVHSVATLRRAALLAGLLALIAGFLGMHILAGSHGHHPQASAPGGIQSSTAPATAAVKPAAATIGGTQVPPSCACEGGCAEKPSAHTGCTPSPSGASLGAPHPGTTPLEHRPWTAVRADRLSGYAYLPGTPTPLDLSISRT